MSSFKEALLNLQVGIPWLREGQIVEGIPLSWKVVDFPPREPKRRKKEETSLEEAYRTLEEIVFERQRQGRRSPERKKRKQVKEPKKPTLELQIMRECSDRVNEFSRMYSDLAARFKQSAEREKEQGDDLIRHFLYAIVTKIHRTVGKRVKRCTRSFLDEIKAAKNEYEVCSSSFSTNKKRWKLQSASFDSLRSTWERSIQELDRMNDEIKMRFQKSQSIEQEFFKRFHEVFVRSEEERKKMESFSADLARTESEVEADYRCLMNTDTRLVEILRRINQTFCSNAKQYYAEEKTAIEKDALSYVHAHRPSLIKKHGWKDIPWAKKKMSEHFWKRVAEELLRFAKEVEIFSAVYEATDLGTKQRDLKDKYDSAIEEIHAIKAEFAEFVNLIEEAKDKGEKASQESQLSSIQSSFSAESSAEKGKSVVADLSKIRGATKEMVRWITSLADSYAAVSRQRAELLKREESIVSLRSQLDKLSADKVSKESKLAEYEMLRDQLRRKTEEVESIVTRESSIVRELETKTEQWKEKAKEELDKQMETNRLLTIERDRVEEQMKHLEEERSAIASRLGAVATQLRDEMARNRVEAENAANRNQELASLLQKLQEKYDKVIRENEDLTFAVRRLESASKENIGSALVEKERIVFSLEAQIRDLERIKAEKEAQDLAKQEAKVRWEAVEEILSQSVKTTGESIDIFVRGIESSLSIDDPASKPFRELLNVLKNEMKSFSATLQKQESDARRIKEEKEKESEVLKGQIAEERLKFAEKVADLEARLKSSEEEREQLQQQLVKQVQREAQLSQQNAELLVVVSQIRMEKEQIEQQYAASLSQLASLQQDLRNTEENLRRKTEEWTSEKIKLERISKEREAERQKIAQLSAERKSLEEETRQSREELSTFRTRVIESEKEVEQTRQEIAAIREKTQKLEASVIAISEELDRQSKENPLFEIIRSNVERGSTFSETVRSIAETFFPDDAELREEAIRKMMTLDKEEQIYRQLPSPAPSPKDVESYPSWKLVQIGLSTSLLRRVGEVAKEGWNRSRRRYEEESARAKEQENRLREEVAEKRTEVETLRTAISANEEQMNRLRREKDAISRGEDIATTMMQIQSSLVESIRDKTRETEELTERAKVERGRAESLMKDKKRLEAEILDIRQELEQSRELIASFQQTSQQEVIAFAEAQAIRETEEAVRTQEAIEKIRLLEKNVREREKAVDQLVKKLEETEENLESSRQGEETSRKMATAFQEEIKRLKEEAREREERTRTLEREKVQIVETANRIAQALQDQVQKLEQTIARERQRADEETTNVADLTERLDRARRENNKLKEEKAKVEEERKKIEQDLSIFQAANADYVFEIQRLKDQIEEMIEEDKTAEKLQEYEAIFIQSERAMREKDIQIAELSKRVEVVSEYEKRMEALEEEIKNLQAQRDTKNVDQTAEKKIINSLLKAMEKTTRSEAWRENIRRLESKISAEHVGELFEVFVQTERTLALQEQFRLGEEISSLIDLNEERSESLAARLNKVEATMASVTQQLQRTEPIDWEGEAKRFFGAIVSSQQEAEEKSKILLEKLSRASTESAKVQLFRDLLQTSALLDEIRKMRSEVRRSKETVQTGISSWEEKRELEIADAKRVIRENLQFPPPGSIAVVLIGPSPSTVLVERWTECLRTLDRIQWDARNLVVPKFLSSFFSALAESSSVTAEKVAYGLKISLLVYFLIDVVLAMSITESFLTERKIDGEVAKALSSSYAKAAFLMHNAILYLSTFFVVDDAFPKGSIDSTIAERFLGMSGEEMERGIAGLLSPGGFSGSNTLFPNPSAWRSTVPADLVDRVSTFSQFFFFGGFNFSQWDAMLAANVSKVNYDREYVESLSKFSLEDVIRRIEKEYMYYLYYLSKGAEETKPVGEGAAFVEQVQSSKREHIIALSLFHHFLRVSGGDEIMRYDTEKGTSVMMDVFFRTFATEEWKTFFSSHPYQGAYLASVEHYPMLLYEKRGESYVPYPAKISIPAFLLFLLVSDYRVHRVDIQDKRYELTYEEVASLWTGGRIKTVESLEAWKTRTKEESLSSFSVTSMDKTTAEALALLSSWHGVFSVDRDSLTLIGYRTILPVRSSIFGNGVEKSLAFYANGMFLFHPIYSSLADRVLLATR